MGHGAINTMIYSAFFLQPLFFFFFFPPYYWSQRVLRTGESRGRSRERFCLCLQESNDRNFLLHPYWIICLNIDMFFLFIIISIFNCLAKHIKPSCLCFQTELCPGIVQIINLILKYQQISKDFKTDLSILFFSFRIVGTSYLQQIGILD